jgi:branched-chain amino acid aminotransferase
MPCEVRRVAAHGEAEVQRVACTARTITEATSMFSEGIYGAFTTWHGLRVICLSKHLDRLEDSARRVGFQLELDRKLFIGELGEAIRDTGFGEVKLRVGASPGDRFLTVLMEPFPGPPLSERATGVVCATVRHTARANPLAKQTGWLTTRKAFAKLANAYEYLLVDEHNQILEGSSSNFFAIVEEGAERQPAIRTAGKGVLPGISRSIVLDAAAPLPVHPESVLIGDLSRIGEAFLTSASRGIVPIVQIDRVTIGNGQPGPLTRELTRRYETLAADLEEQL